jgi:hypothetical protein
VKRPRHFRVRIEPFQSLAALFPSQRNSQPPPRPEGRGGRAFSAPSQSLQHVGRLILSNCNCQAGISSDSWETRRPAAASSRAALGRRKTLSFHGLWRRSFSRCLAVMPIWERAFRHHSESFGRASGGFKRPSIGFGKFQIFSRNRELSMAYGRTVQFCLSELASPPEPPAVPRFRVVLLSLDLRVLRSFFKQARAGAVLRSWMGVLIQTLERLSSDPAGRGASLREKQNHGVPRTQSPRRVKTDDRSDVGQEYVRFTRARTGFEPSAKRTGASPSYLRLSLESLPLALCFVVARGDAAAFRRARFGLSSSEMISMP